MKHASSEWKDNTLKRLTEKHPLTDKVEKLMGFLEEQGLSIGYSNRTSGFTITDKSRPNEEVYMVDAENGMREGIDVMPPAYEFKMVIPED